MKKKLFSTTNIMGFFIIFIMVTSVFGVLFYGFNSGSDSVKYGKYKFTLTNNGYRTNINGKNIIFSYLPDQVVDINVSSGVISLLKNAKVAYISYDSNSLDSSQMALVQYNLQKNFMDNLNIYAGVALTSNNSYSLPIITCANASSFVPVIEIKEANESRIFFDNNCILLESARTSDFERVKDRLLYLIYGVME